MKNYSSHLISLNSTLKDGLIKINQIIDGILCLFIINSENKLVGTLTDGDIRRALIKGSLLDEPIEVAMEKKFQSVCVDEVSPGKIKIFRSSGIKLLPCIDDEGRIVKIYDLVAKESIIPIDAVIMAGGKGERLMPLTKNTPKPLLKVGGKAIIDYNVDRLILYGVENIHITVNYMAEQIEAHFSQERDGVNISCIREEKYFGTMGSVKFIKNFHYDTVLVMNSDLFTNVDLEDFYSHHIEQSADISVAAIPYSVSVPYGILDLDGKDIKGLLEKPTYNYYANGGIYLVKRKLFDLIPADLFFDATDFIELLIDKKYKVVRFPLIGYWIDIGKPEDYKKVQEIAQHIKK